MIVLIDKQFHGYHCRYVHISYRFIRIQSYRCMFCMDHYCLYRYTVLYKRLSLVSIHHPDIEG